MLKIDIDKNGYLDADIDNASASDLADALEMSHYLARDLKHQDMGWKILDVVDQINERIRNEHR